MQVRGKTGTTESLCVTAKTGRRAHHQSRTTICRVGGNTLAKRLAIAARQTLIDNHGTIRTSFHASLFQGRDRCLGVVHGSGRNPPLRQTLNQSITTHVKIIHDQQPGPFERIETCHFRHRRHAR